MTMNRLFWKIFLLCWGANMLLFGALLVVFFTTGGPPLPRSLVGHDALALAAQAVVDTLEADGPEAAHADLDELRRASRSQFILLTDAGRPVLPGDVPADILAHVRDGAAG